MMFVDDIVRDSAIGQETRSRALAVAELKMFIFSLGDFNGRDKREHASGWSVI